MSKIAYVEFSTLIATEAEAETDLNLQTGLTIEKWLSGQQLVAGAKELLARFMKEGWQTILAFPMRPQADKAAIQAWLNAQEVVFNKLDLPRTVGPTTNFERWLVSRLHDLSEFEEPQAISALLRPASLSALNKQLNGPLMDWQPKGLNSATTVEQATNRFFGTKRSLFVKPG